MTEHKDDFELHAETLMEGAKALEQTDDDYETHLAYEMLLGLEESDVEEVRYEDIQDKMYYEGEKE